MRRLLKTLLLVELGAWIGSIASAALVKRALPSRGDETSDEVALASILGGISFASSAEAFRGGSMLSWFGGTSIDLRDAKLAPDAHLTVGAIFGGVDLVVPPGWRVVHSARGFAGGISVNVEEPEDPDAPTLTLEVTTAFGGVSIRTATAEDAGES